MTPTICYQTDEAARFLCAVDAYPFYTDPERLNVPFRAVEVAPPPIPAGHFARWVSPFTEMDPEYSTVGEWTLEAIPPPPEPPVEQEIPPEEEAPAQA